MLLAPQDMVSEQPEKFFVAELIREKIFFMYQQEIPYSVQVGRAASRLLAWASLHTHAFGLAASDLWAARCLGCALSRYS